MSWPVVMSNCIAVGGTTLIWSPTISNAINRIEYTWPLAGGGYSTSVIKPTYQNGINTNMYRSIPDVSMGTDGSYNAAKGYDIATGLGSPNATILLNLI